MQVDNGVNIDPNWTDVISISHDGTNWDNISKEGLSVGQSFVGKPMFTYKYDQVARIILKRGDQHILSFDIQQVTNQAGWTGDPSGLQQAVSDITSWL